MWLKIGFGNFFLPLANIYKQLSKKQSIHRYQPSGICMMCIKNYKKKEIRIFGEILIIFLYMFYTWEMNIW